MDIESSQDNKIIRVLHILGVLCLISSMFMPLIVVSSMFYFPFITGKVWFFRTMIVLCLAFTIPLAMYSNVHKYKLNKLYFAVIFYAVFMFISSVFGVDFHKSWWGSHERMLGLFSVLHYCALMFIIPVYVKEWENVKFGNIFFLGWKFFFRIMIIVSSSVAILGLIQRRVDGFLFGDAGGRVFSTLGNFIYLGNYMAISMIIIMILLIYEKNKVGRIFLAFLFVIHFLNFIYSGSRGAVVGMFFGVLSAILFAFLFESKQIRKKIIYFFIAIISSLILIFGPLKDRIAEMSLFSRLVQITDQANYRLYAWNTAISAWKEKPLFGWGYDNYYVAFNKYLDIRMLGNSFYETWFDNAHNAILNTLATSGILGLFAYLAVYFFALCLIFKKLKNSELKTRLALYCAVAMILTDFFTKIFVFDNPTSLITFYISLAFIAHYNLEYQKNIQKFACKKKISVVFAACFIFALALVLQTDIQPAMANAKTLSLVSKSYENPEIILSNIEKIIAIQTPYIADIRMDLARAVVELAPIIKSNVLNDAFEKVIERTSEGLDTALKIHNLDIQIMLRKIELLRYLLPNEQAEKEIDEIFKVMIDLSPNRQQLYYLYSYVKMTEKKFDEAIQYVDKAISINPNVGRTYWVKGQIYYAIGNFDNAWENVRKALYELQFRPESFNDVDFASKITYEAKYKNTVFIDLLLDMFDKSGEQTPYEILLRAARMYELVENNEKTFMCAQRLETLYPEKIYEFKDLLKK